MNNNIAIITKKCIRCNELKLIDNFHKDATRKDEHHPYCKECCKKLLQVYMESHREEARIRTREWRKNNIQRREEYLKNENVKKQRKEYMKQYRLLHKERKRECSKKYEYRRSREDAQYRLLINLRKRLSVTIKGKQKTGSAVRDLGCSIPELMKYLESKFQPGMTWENWGLGTGKWQIDHIKALCLFNLLDREQFLEACNYNNLQPIWYEDHVIKTANDVKEKKNNLRINNL
jgi:hypothetical protein